jgi:ATP-binding cassette subfamily F protein uup
MLGMFYVIIILIYLNVIGDESEYSPVMMYYLGLMIGRFVYFDASFSDFIDALKNLFGNLLLLILGLALTGGLSYFGFEDMTQYNYFGNLSGGEKRRLYLLKVLMANPNFLILDEPTNDLDIYTLEILEQFLKDYKGCLVIVSHDRSFMDHIVDHIFVFEGDGKIRDYHSNYTQYLAEKNAQKRSETLQRREEKPKYERTRSDKPRATYKQQKEYESLSQEIETLTQEKQQLETLLSGGGETDVEKLTSASQRIGEIMAALDEKELRWLELDEIVNG